MFAFLGGFDGGGGEDRFQPVFEAAEVFAERGPQFGHAEPAGENAADGQQGERTGHGERRFVNVGGTSGATREVP